MGTKVKCLRWGLESAPAAWSHGSLTTSVSTETKGHSLGGFGELAAPPLLPRGAGFPCGPSWPPSIRPLHPAPSDGRLLGKEAAVPRKSRTAEETREMTAVSTGTLHLPGKLPRTQAAKPGGVRARKGHRKGLSAAPGWGEQRNKAPFTGIAPACSLLES